MNVDRLCVFLFRHCQFCKFYVMCLGTLGCLHVFIVYYGCILFSIVACFDRNDQISPYGSYVWFNGGLDNSQIYDKP